MGFRISAEEIETFSQRKWDELYQLAQRYNPYYLIGTVELNNGTPILKIYDGIYLQRYLSQYPITSSCIPDPLTRLTILKVHFYVLPTFENNTEGKAQLLPFEKAQNHAIEVSEMIKTFNDKYLSIFFDSLNYNIAAKSRNSSEQVKKCQCIIFEKIQQFRPTSPN